MHTRRYEHFAVGDLVEVNDNPEKRGVIIREIDIDPPCSQWPFLVLIGGAAAYGMSKDGTLYDTLTGRNTGTVVCKARQFREFYVIIDKGVNSISVRTGHPEDALRNGWPVARLRWYEDGEVAQITEGDVR